MRVANRFEMILVIFLSGTTKKEFLNIDIDKLFWQQQKIEREFNKQYVDGFKILFVTLLETYFWDGHDCLKTRL